MVNNPYIELVWADSHILQDEEYLYNMPGKWQSYFWNTQEIVLEIGTGFGEFIAKQAYLFPEKNFIGMELKYKRLYKTAEKLYKNNATNFALIQDFGQNIDKIFAPWELSTTYVLFPDPWHNKRRQFKHKLLQPQFLQDLFEKTKLWWKFIFQTDHRAYFDDVVEDIKKQWLWKIEDIDVAYQSEIGTQKTVFENMFRAQGKDICYGVFIKN